MFIHKVLDTASVLRVYSERACMRGILVRVLIQARDIIYIGGESRGRGKGEVV